MLTFTGVSCFLGIYLKNAIDKDLDRALEYPESKLGFAWKQEYEKDPRSCLAENTKEHYRTSPSDFIHREYCINSSSSIAGHYGQTISQDKRECTVFKIDKKCIDHFVEQK